LGGIEALDSLTIFRRMLADATGGFIEYDPRDRAHTAKPHSTPAKSLTSGRKGMR
jgi:hypothetical protein